MVLKRKEIIAAALVVLIGAAGYLNWSYQDTIRVTDGASYIETGKKLGEAQYVNATTEQEEYAATETLEQGPQPVESAAAEASAAPENGAAPSATEPGNAMEGVQYFDQAKMDKDASRSKSLEVLNQTAQNESFDAEIRKKAQEQVLEVANNIEKETAIENIAKAKGYADICVYVDEDMVDVMVKKADLSEKDVIKLQEIATEQLKISAKNIKIVEVK